MVLGSVLSCLTFLCCFLDTDSQSALCFCSCFRFSRKIITIGAVGFFMKEWAQIIGRKYRALWFEGRLLRIFGRYGSIGVSNEFVDWELHSHSQAMETLNKQWEELFN